MGEISIWAAEQVKCGFNIVSWMDARNVLRGHLLKDLQDTQGLVGGSPNYIPILCMYAYVCEEKKIQTLYILNTHKALRVNVYVPLVSPSVQPTGSPAPYPAFFLLDSISQKAVHPVPASSRHAARRALWEMKS